MVFNYNNDNNMELPLNEQLTILKMAKRQYTRLVTNWKKVVPYNTFKFDIDFIDSNNIYLYGLCYCIKTALKPKIYSIEYYDITNYIPIFSPYNIMKIAKELNVKIKHIDNSAIYYYPLEEYRNRINILNLLIKYLQLKIKENGNN